MNQPTLAQATELISKINDSEDYTAYFSTGKIVVEENLIIIKSNRRIQKWKNHKNK